MGNINELIERLCPNGVKYMQIKEIGQVKMCKRILKSETNNIGGVPFYKIGTFGKNADAFISEETFRKYKEQYSYPKKGDILISCSGTIGRTVIFDGEPAYFQDSNIVWLEHDGTKVTNEYLRHIYATQPWQISSGGTIARLYNDNILNTRIAVPPLEVQEKIVHILDDFTLLSAELSAELLAELKARQEQYDWYRNELLKSNDNVKVIKFGDIARIQRGASPRPISEYITEDENGVNWVKIGDVEIGKKYITKCKEKITVEGSKKSRFVKKGDFILSNSMSFGRPYIMAIDGCIHDGWLSISEFQEYFIPDFLYHLLNSNDIQNTFKQKASFGGAVQNLNADIVRNIELPLFTIQKQKEIVSILDKFERYINDIKEGLPAEIEARQKQYEYYRDKLLTFKEISNE